MTTRRAALPKFHTGDHVRLIDNTPAEVCALSNRKNYYIVRSPIHGVVEVFAGDIDRDIRATMIVPIDIDEEVIK